jgi:4-diphosphocytidyl-2-C-methyl-D-erythritol kinase
MIVFPNAKINLGLNVIEKRTDGFHNIESCLVPVPWYDALEVVEARQLQFKSTGIKIPGEGNICLLAYTLLKNDYSLPPINIHLHKNIPIGAGLGGGSSDGAFMLKLLNDKFSLGLETNQLKQYAGKLGSDCSFFIENKPRFVEGAGDILSGIKLDLSGLYLVIIYPNVHISTQSAYQGLVPDKSTTNLKDTLEKESVSQWKQYITNDFEINAGVKVLELKEMLYSQGAQFASMTGSGSAVYGLFTKRPDLKTPYPNIIASL